jgi:hypothetical protein
MLEIRNGDTARAINLTRLALRQHSGTGRLWACLVQLRHFDLGEEAQFESLKLALNAVPKSGEVWCEGARIHLNPFARTFDLPRARRHLFFATKFTPQYGDGFLETLRLEILEQWLEPVATLIWESTQGRLSLTDNAFWEKELVQYVLGVSQTVFALCKLDGEEDSNVENPVISGSGLDKSALQSIRDHFEPDALKKVFDISQLELRCANADPNYGSLWFHCRAGPTDTARKVLSRAMGLMLNELRVHSHLYVLALLRRFAILSCLEHDQEANSDEGKRKESVAADTGQREELVNEAFLSAPSLRDIMDAGNENTTTGMDLLESTMTGSDFVSGLVALSRHRPMDKMTLPDRRKALFGTDALFS